jgi:hypothetical protein
VAIEMILLHCLGEEAFVARAVAADPDAEVATLRARWRAARRTLRQLRALEPGCADDSGVLPIPPTMVDHVAEITASPRIQAAFCRVPVAFGLVDTESLIPSKDSLCCDRLEQWRRALLRGAADDAVLVRTCLPLAKGRAGPPPVVHAARLGGRLLLLDGHHRVRALASLGVRYVPCIISACNDLEELGALPTGLQRHGLRRRLAGARPPLLRDYLRRSLVFAHPASPRVAGRPRSSARIVPPTRIIPSTATRRGARAPTSRSAP